METLPFFFFSTIGQRKVSSDLVDRKLVILYYENIDLKTSPKFCIFSRWLDHGFWSKNGNFALYSFLAKHNNLFCDLVERKLATLDFKNIHLKKSKILHSFKGVSLWFLVKNYLFYSFLFFSKIGQKKVFFDLAGRKLAILDYKNVNLKKSEILNFSKGVSPWLLVKNRKFTLLCFEAK